MFLCTGRVLGQLRKKRRAANLQVHSGESHTMPHPSWSTLQPRCRIEDSACSGFGCYDHRLYVRSSRDYPPARHASTQRFSLPHFDCDAKTAKRHHTLACSPVLHKCLFLGAGLLERCCLFPQKRADTTNATPFASIKPGVLNYLCIYVYIDTCVHVYPLSNYVITRPPDTRFVTKTHFTSCARWHHVRGSCQPANDNFACSSVQQKCLFLCAGLLERCLTTNVAPCMIVQPGVVIKTLMLHTKLASCRSLSSSIRAFSCAHILCHSQVGQHSSRDAESKTVLAVDSGAEIIDYMLGHHETTYLHTIRQHDAVHILTAMPRLRNDTIH